MTDGEGVAPRRRLPIAAYPLVFPAAIVVHVWAGTAIHPSAMVRPFIIAMVIAIALVVLLTLVSRSRDLGALAATAVALWLIAANAYPTIVLVLVPAFILLVALGLAKRGQPWRLGEIITRGMTFVVVITVIAVGLQTVQSGALGRAVSDVQLDLAGLGPTVAPNPGDPDVYLILLDGYPGADAAALDPTWDATAFGAALRERNFDVPDPTHSNYLQTLMTLASVFDMRHLADIPSLGPPYGPAELDGFRLRRAINDSQGLANLHDRGYELTSIASGFAQPELRRVDHFIEPVGLDEYEVGVMRETGAGEVLMFLAPDLPGELQRNRIATSLEALTSEATRASDRPKFVFAHIAGPHPPYVYDASGNPRRDGLSVYYADSGRDRGIDRLDALRLHLAQSTYIAGRTLDAVDRILATSKAPPVIVIFSDHGSGSGFDQARPLESDLVERSSNILAVYSPGHPGLFAAPTTPVNILPRIFDAYLGMTVPEQPDTTYAWRNGRLDTVLVEPPRPEAQGNQ
jgi:hypothetical protein